MNDSRKPRTGALLVTLVTVVLVAGCTSAPNGSAEVEPTQAAASTASSPSASGDGSSAGTYVQAGDVLAHRPEQLGENLRAYKLADSTYAVVDPSQPLPEVVRADVQSRVDSQIQDPGTPDAVGTNRSTIVNTAQETASLAGLQSGKSVVVIFPLVGSCTIDEEAYLGWAHTAMAGADDGCRVLRTVEESRAQVEAAIVATGEADKYEVFVHAS